MTIQEQQTMSALYHAIDASERTVLRLEQEKVNLLACLSWERAPWYGKLWIRARQWWRERRGAKAVAA